MGPASVLGRQVLPTQACHPPQAGEGVLQAATLLRTGPTAPQRLLHLGLVHLQQGIQCELSEDLLKKHRGTGRQPVSMSTQGSPTPSSCSPLARAGLPAEWQGPAAGGPASDLRPPLVRELRQPALTPPPKRSRRQQLK